MNLLHYQEMMERIHLVDIMKKMVTLLPKRIADKVVRLDNKEQEHIGLRNDGDNIVFYTTEENIERAKQMRAGNISSIK